MTMFYVGLILYSRFQAKAEIELDIIFINCQYGLQCEVVLGWIIWVCLSKCDVKIIFDLLLNIYIYTFIYQGRLKIQHKLC